VLTGKIVGKLTLGVRLERHCPNTICLGRDFTYSELTVTLPWSLTTLGHRIEFDATSKGSKWD
jgi:hypothetical protein